MFAILVKEFSPIVAQGGAPDKLGTQFICHCEEAPFLHAVYVNTV